MKKIVKRLLCAMLALVIVLRGIMLPENPETVEAAAKSSYFGYDTYVEFFEATGLNTGASKKAVSDVSQRISGTTDDGGFTYYTYSELAASMGFVIPKDCSKILVDEGGTTYVGYKSDGSKVVIVKTDGYNFFGYDVNGYDRYGYDVNGYDRNGHDRNWTGDAFDETQPERKEVVKISKLIFNKEIISYIKLYDWDNDGYLDEYEISFIKSFSSNKKIKDVSGLKYFTALEKVNFGNYQGTKIDLSKNKKCKLVSINSKNKKQLFTLNAPYATYIHLIISNSKSIDISACTKAVYLFVQDKYDTAQTINMPKKNSNLRYIYTWMIERSSVDLNKYKNLQVAELLEVGSKLTEVSADKCGKLEFLMISCAENLKSLDLSKCGKLRCVYVPACKKLNKSKVNTRRGVTKIFKWQERPKNLRDREETLESEILKKARSLK